MANPNVVVEFKADTSQLQTGLKQAGSSASTFGSSLKSVAKVGALAAGAAGIGAIAETLKIGFGEWKTSQTVMAQTEAVLKSTGQAAGVTADHVADLATATMKKTGIDDEAIQSGENMLATFTNIHNEIGKGNDIFDQATAAVTDMDTAMTKGHSTQESLSKTAIQVGKALQDPIKGATALRRVGVQLTESQQETIKALVKTGDTMGAQKIILGELTKEFGGSAEAIGKTLPGQLNIVKESFNNLAGDLVGKLAPALQATITYLTQHWPEISAAIQQGWEAIKPTLQAFGDLVVSIVNLIRDNWGTIGPIVKTVADLVKANLKVMADVIQIVADLLRGDWSGAWKAAVDLVTNLVKQITDRVQLAMQLIKVAVDLAWKAIQALTTLVWNQIRGTIQTVTTAITTTVTTGWNAIKTAITTAMTAVQTAITTAWNTIKTLTTTAMTAIKTAVTTAMSAINTTMITTWNTIKATVTAALNAVKATVTTVWNGIKAVVQAAVGPITSAVSLIATAFHKPAAAATTMLSEIRQAFGAIAGAINAVVGAVGAAAQKVADAIMKPINAAKSVVNTIIGKFNAIRFTIPTITIPSVTILGHKVGGGTIGGQSWGVPQIPLLAQGGIVMGPTLAMIGEAGPEMVLPLGSGGAPIEVRVFIGETELRGLVRTEVVTQNNRVAQTLLAGAV